MLSARRLASNKISEKFLTDINLQMDELQQPPGLNPLVTWLPRETTFDFPEAASWGRVSLFTLLRHSRVEVTSPV
jgi:hypothetical protein